MPSTPTTIQKIDTQTFLEDFSKILNKMTDENSAYEKLKNYLETNFNELNISAETKFKIIVEVLAQQILQFTQSAGTLALEFHKTLAQIKLSDAELEFNKARTELVKAQKDAEIARKNAIEREIKGYDDNLRVKEAECLKDVTFGYVSGGVAVPEKLNKTLFNAIDNITQN